MKNKLQYYLKLDYPISINRMTDGNYCAEIPIIKGCKGYGASISGAVEELENVKTTLIKLMIEQGKSIPEPTIEIEIPKTLFRRLPNRNKLLQFAK